MKYCSTCGQAHAPHAQYCEVDGTSLDKQARPIRFEQTAHFCVGCGTQMDGRASYCPNCGHSRLVAATSEGSLVDRLPGMDDIRKKWKSQDWNVNLPWKERGRAFFSRFDFSLGNPSLAIGSIAAVICFAAIVVILFIMLGLLSDNPALDGIKTVQQNVGNDFSTFGMFFFLAFVALAGLQLTSSEDLKSRFLTEVIGNDADQFSDIQKAINQLDFHIFSGHFLLSLPGLILLIGSAWLLERGGVIGINATSWNERIERAIVFALTLSVITLVVGLFATDFGVFDLHLITGMIRIFLLALAGVLLFQFIGQTDLRGSWQIGRIAATTLMSVYLFGVLLTSFGQLYYLNELDELDEVEFGESASLVLLSGASPLYAMSQAGQVDFKMTVLTEDFHLGAALYGEDRLNDLKQGIDEADDASNLDRIQRIIGNQIQNGEDPTLDPKVTRFDETVDVGLLTRFAQIANASTPFEEEQLLNSSVAPYGLIVLVLMFVIHIGIGFRWIRTLPNVAIYAGVFMVGGLILAYFTQTRFELQWDNDILAGVVVSTLTWWNAFMLFLFPFLGGLVGYGLNRFKDTKG